VLSRPTYLLLVVALLTARVTCAWGMGADPCCSGNTDVHDTAIENQLGTAEVPHEDGLDHTLHAGHCHCLWEMVAVVAVVAPGEGQPDWGAHHPELPTAEPRTIDWPPRPGT